MTAVVVQSTPTLIAAANTPVQFFIQNQGSNSVRVLTTNGSGGTLLQTGDTLIMGFQDPLVPKVQVYGVAPIGNTALVDIQQWPF